MAGGHPERWWREQTADQKNRMSFSTLINTPIGEFGMPTVSIVRHQIEDGSLPPICIVCGKDSTHQRFAGAAAPSTWWAMAPLIGLLTFWVYVLFVSLTSRDKSGLPFCDRHRNYWPRRAWFIVGGFFVLVMLGVFVNILNPPDIPGQKKELHWILAPFACWLLIFLPAFPIIHLLAMRPTGGNAKTLTISGAHKNFIAALRATE